MLKVVKLDPNISEPPYPHKDWNPEAERKWAMMVGGISLAEPYEKTTNPDGTMTFSQEQGPPAMRIFRSP